MGRKIVLTGVTLTDPNAPRLVKVDPIESDGSLVLFEPAHPLSKMGAGVPTDGQVTENLFRDNAALVTGLGSPATWDIEVAYKELGGAKGLIERSGKGGLHVIVSQDPAMYPGPYPYLFTRNPNSFRDHMAAAPNNDLFVSMWGRITRAGYSGDVTYNSTTYTSGVGSTAYAYVITGTSNQRLNIGPRSANAESLGSRDSGPYSTGPYIENLGSGKWFTAPSSGSSVHSEFVTLGGFGVHNLYASGARTCLFRWASFIIYRYYMEDLTISGRSYAEVDAIDYALYTKHVLTPGGRYYGDTFTDPATIP